MKNVVVGFNSDRDLYSGACYGEHAETNALAKLIKVNQRQSNKLINIDLLVIKTDRNFCLKNSKPCHKCISYMMNFPKYGYRIRYVYYSDQNGNIIKTNLTDLSDDNYAHTSRRFR